MRHSVVGKPYIVQQRQTNTTSSRIVKRLPFAPLPPPRPAWPSVAPTSDMNMLPVTTPSLVGGTHTLLHLPTLSRQLSAILGRVRTLSELSQSHER